MHAQDQCVVWRGEHPAGSQEEVSRRDIEKERRHSSSIKKRGHSRRIKKRRHSSRIKKRRDMRWYRVGEQE